MSIDTKEFWQSAWQRHHRSYLRTIGFQAYYLSFILKPNERKLLELGAGSFRDTARLNEWGYDCTGTDFSEESVQLAQQTFPHWASKIQVQDASNLQFPDGAFDVTFHNGFWVLFQEDAFLDQLLKEQVRVSRSRVVCTVHNALNQRQRAVFAEKAREDELYDIRFFEPDEMRRLLQPHCREVRIYPYSVLHFNRLMKLIKHRALLKVVYLATHRLWRIQHWERLMVVGEVPQER
jgi:ubiquinone/menaquinone biosynthesis C-methylase UbiE